MRLMTYKFTIRCIALLFFLCHRAFADSHVLHHELQVNLDPTAQTLQVIDRVSLNGLDSFEFTLHAGLNPRSLSSGTALQRIGQSSGDVALETYRVTLADGQEEVQLSYGGRIAHDFKSRTESPGREQKLLAGTISSDGVFLDGRVAWYPYIENVLQTFDLSVRVPKGWSVISQGQGPGVDVKSNYQKISWKASQPQDDIYLVAGRYHVYSDHKANVESQVYLREPDEQLAQRYLGVTNHYIRLYEQLIGDYPYSKFALVENFWETGYGMPSFTLLGSRVIRLPFILHSSYPHEILHNWWGNGVYVDFDKGNWSEGLTAYLADHLIKEQQGQGIQHRRSSLQRFGSFVKKENDFPLSTFSSRHSGSSQAVGYDKSMMLFHMLRRKLGDQVFIDGLRLFYKDNRFRQAGFDDVQGAFERSSQQDLGAFFDQWLNRKSAPDLKIKDVKVLKLVVGYRIEIQIWQTQTADPFVLDIPVTVYSGEDARPEYRILTMNNRTQVFAIDTGSKPVRVDVDPWFDLFRQLDSSEAPPVLSQLFGKQRMLFILPGNAPAGLLKGYQKMAQQWAKGYQQVNVKFDHEIDKLPDDQSVWLLGWQNRFRSDYFKSFDSHELFENGDGFKLADKDVDQQQHALVLTRRSGKGQVLGWVGTNNLNSLPGLSRKLPHYGKYSYLVFSGDAPSILLKGQWETTDSILKKRLDNVDRVISEARPRPLWAKTNDKKVVE